jgi:hypothetical protein
MSGFANYTSIQIGFSNFFACVRVLSFELMALSLCDGYTLLYTHVHTNSLLLFYLNIIF